MLIFQPEIKERTNVPDNQGTATVLLRFVSLRSASTKIGDVKMDRHDRELLDKQMRRRLMPCLRRTNNALRFASLSIRAPLWRRAGNGRQSRIARADKLPYSDAVVR